MAASKKMTYTGAAISGLASLMFLFSALMKLKGGPELEVVWLGIYLREPRLKALLPVRTSDVR